MKPIWAARIVFWALFLLYLFSMFRMVTTHGGFERYWAAFMFIITSIFAQMALNRITDIKDAAHLRKVASSARDSAPHDRI